MSWFLPVEPEAGAQCMWTKYEVFAEGSWNRARQLELQSRCVLPAGASLDSDPQHRDGSIWKQGTSFLGWWVGKGKAFLT